MSSSAGPGRIYAWITGIFADSNDPTIVHYFTAEDVVNASVYSIAVAVLLTLITCPSTGDRSFVIFAVAAHIPRRLPRGGLAPFPFIAARV